MTIGVYGLGRFGYFWASLLAEKYNVKGYSRRVKKKTPDGVEVISRKDLLRCDVIFLCVAISAMEEVLKEISPHVKPGTLIVDTCSVKVYPVKLMKSILPEDVFVLATHPMFGPDSGKRGVEGLPIVFCPVRVTREIEKEWREIFCSYKLRIIDMTPEKHDYNAAYTQGITHFIGRVLGDLHLELSPIATEGYKKLLEIIEQTCNDPFQLFIDLQHYNPSTEEMRKNLYLSLRRVMDKFEASLDSKQDRRYDKI